MEFFFFVALPSFSTLRTIKTARLINEKNDGQKK